MNTYAFTHYIVIVLINLLFYLVMYLVIFLAHLITF